MVSQQQKIRVAHIEATLRNQNDRGRREWGSFLGEDCGEAISVMCECGFDTCEGMADVLTEEYAAIRSNPRWFLVLPDHVQPEGEVVVQHGDRFWVIEKTGAAGKVAEARA